MQSGDDRRVCRYARPVPLLYGSILPSRFRLSGFARRESANRDAANDAPEDEVSDGHRDPTNLVSEK